MLTHINLAEAISFASLAHAHQVDKGQAPYILHPLQVMLRVFQPDLMNYEEGIAAVLHDVVEDTEISLEQIQELYGPRVRDIVDTLTRREGEQYFYYIERVKMNPSAKKIKLADLAENMRQDRRAPNKEQYVARYQRAVEILTK